VNKKIEVSILGKFVSGWVKDKLSFIYLGQDRSVRKDNRISNIGNNPTNRKGM
jgi:hypothetical protein